MPNYLYSIGVDVSKEYLDAFNPITKKVTRFTNNKNGIKKFVKELQKLDNAVVIIEPTGGYELIKIFVAQLRRNLRVVKEKYSYINSINVAGLRYCN